MKSIITIAIAANRLESLDSLIRLLIGEREKVFEKRVGIDLDGKGNFVCGNDALEGPLGFGRDFELNRRVVCGLLVARLARVHHHIKHVLDQMPVHVTYHEQRVGCFQAV